MSERSLTRRDDATGGPANALVRVEDDRSGTAAPAVSSDGVSRTIARREHYAGRVLPPWATQVPTADTARRASRVLVGVQAISPMVALFVADWLVPHAYRFTAALVCCVVAATVGAAAPIVVMRRRSAPLRRAKLLTAASAEIAPGTWVRLRGVVAPGATFRSPGTGRASVVAQILVRQRNHVLEPWDTVEERRGVDFMLQVDGLGAVVIDVTHAFLVDPPRRRVPVRDEILTRLAVTKGPWARMRIAEATVASGDTLEVTGLFDRIPDPRGEAGPGGRGPRLLPILRGTEVQPVLMRAL